jgi:hypothetical protein
LSKLNGKEVASLTGFKSLMMEDIPFYEHHICFFLVVLEGEFFPAATLAMQ